MDKFPQFKGKSESLLIDRDDPKIAAHTFAKDPVEIFTRIREETDIPEPEDLYDPDLNPVAEATVQTEGLLIEIDKSRIEITEPRLRVFAENGFYTEKGDETLFSLYKEAGFTKEEVEAWTRFEYTGMPDEDRFTIRRSLAILDRVYGEE